LLRQPRPLFPPKKRKTGSLWSAYVHQHVRVVLLGVSAAHHDPFDIGAHHRNLVGAGATLWMEPQCESAVRRRFFFNSRLRRLAKRRTFARFWMSSISSRSNSSISSLQVRQIVTWEVVFPGTGTDVSICKDAEDTIAHSIASAAVCMAISSQNQRLSSAINGFEMKDGSLHRHKLEVLQPHVQHRFFFFVFPLPIRGGLDCSILGAASVPARWQRPNTHDA